MKIKFKVIAVGERFKIEGKRFQKLALSLAEDENRIGHLVPAEKVVEADESVKTMAESPNVRAVQRLKRP